MSWSDAAILSQEVAEYAASRKLRIQWVGQLPPDSPSVGSDTHARRELARALAPFHCQPVYVVWVCGCVCCC